MNVYLDNSATTRAFDEVTAYMAHVMKDVYGNPSSMHMAGVDAEGEVKKAREIIAAHGADRILFATDSPWGDQADFVKRIRDYGFSFEDEEKIMWRNAARILGLNTL